MDDIIERINDRLLEKNEKSEIQKMRSIVRYIQTKQNNKTELKDILWLSGLETLIVSCFFDGVVDKGRINKVKSLINL